MHFRKHKSFHSWQHPEMRRWMDRKPWKLGPIAPLMTLQQTHGRITHRSWQWYIGCRRRSSDMRYWCNFSLTFSIGETQYRFVTTDMAQLVFVSMRYSRFSGMHKQCSVKVQKPDAELFKCLCGSGFHFQFGEDVARLVMKYLRRACEYYIDVVASDLVAKNASKCIVATSDWWQKMA